MRRKRIKRLLIVAGSIALFSLMVFLAGRFLLDPIAHRKITKAVENAGKGELIFAVEEVNINLLTQSARLKNIQLYTDSASVNDSTQFLINFATHEIRFTRFSIFSFLFSEKINLSGIRIFEPKIKIEMLQPEINLQKNKHSVKPDSIFKETKIKLIDIDKIKVIHASCQFSSKNTQLPNIKIRDLNFAINNIGILTSDSVRQSFSFGRFSVNGRKLDAHLQEKGTLVTLKEWNFDSNDSIFHLEDLQFEQNRGGENRKTKSQFSHITLNGINPQEIISQKALRIESVSIAGGETQLYRKLGKRRKQVEGIQPNKTKPEIEIAKVSVNDYAIKMIDINTSNIVLKTTDLQLLINDLSLDNGMKPQFSQFEFTTKDLVYKLPDSLHFVKVKEMKNGGNPGEILIRDFVFKPRYNRKNFARKARVQKSGITLKLADIRISDLDFAHLFKTKEVTASNLVAKKFSAHIFSDKTLPPNTKRMPLIQEQVLNSKGKFHIENISLKNGQLILEQKTDKGSKTGKLKMDNIALNIKNSSNIKTKLATNDKMSIKGTARIMGKGRFSFNAQFKLNSKYHQHSFSGSMGKMDMSAINPFIEPTVLVKVERGNISKMNFHLSANKYSSKGQVNLYYNDLKVRVLKKEEQSSSKKKQGFRAGLSLAANAGIKSDNPQKKKPFRVGHIKYKRNSGESSISFWMNSLMEGVKMSVLQPKISKGLRRK